MDRILTTHVGSMIRPAQLRGDLMAMSRGEPYDEERFRENLRTSVDEVVKAQAQVGLDVVNDGEFSKMGYLTSIYDRVEGIESRTLTYDPTAVRDLLPAGLGAKMAGRSVTGVSPEIVGSVDLDHELFRFVPFASTTQDSHYQRGDDGLGWFCTGPIVYDPTQIDHELAILKSALAGVDVEGAFVTSLSPASVFFLTDEHYGDERELVFALAAALREEYLRIIEAGFELSIDDPVMWHKYSTIHMAGGDRNDYAKWADLRIEALNQALEGIPQDRVRYHICSGSSHSAKLFDPTLRDVLPFVQRVKWGKLLFEQGNVGHEHEWATWEDVPLEEGRVLVPGVISHQTHMVEHPELVAQRLIRLANIVGREHVMAGADCGFSQQVWIERADPWVQWAKFRALAEGAALASDRLWGRPEKGREGKGK